MAHSAAPSAFAVGSVIAGTYAIEGVLGKGGMGAVFLASHARLPGKKVAIKVLHADVADSESLARFRREAEIASRLGHPNIVEVHDFNVLPDGTPYLVLEYLVGESLASRIARGPMSLEATVTIVRQIASALAAAHRENIVHRDLKPHNVFLVQTEIDGQLTERAKVLDFGISKIRGSNTVQTQDSAMLGTPQYMAPEQALGRQDQIDARTDVFALGAIVHEMLTGRGTFAGASIPEVVFKVVYEEAPSLAAAAPHLPPHVVDAVHRALAKKPEDRFADVASFIEALTGSPLTTTRGRVQLAPSDGTPPHVATALPVTPPGASKATGRDAFAQTVGSGDHAAAAAIASAATMASGDHGAAAPRTAPAPVAAPLTTHRLATGETVPGPAAPAAAARGKGGLIVAGLAIVAVAAVAIVFLVTRGGGDDAARPADDGRVAARDGDGDRDRAAPPSPVPAVAPATDAAGGAPPAPVVVDAGAAPVAAPPDAAPVTPPIDAGARPRSKADAGAAASGGKDVVAGGGDDAPDDDGGPARQQLAPCLAAANDGDGDEALRCAGKVLEQHPGNAQAYMVRGMAYCLDDDQEKAMGALRKLSGKPRLRRQLVAFCKRQGIDLQ
jgi:serine/threonine-protein kinase